MSEMPGTLIGLSNVMTDLRARVASGPDLDAQPALRDRLRTRALRAIEGRESYIQDAVLYGRRIRLFSNSHHLADFWKDNFPGEVEWKARTPQPVEREPAVTLHAMINVDGEPEGSYASPQRGEAYLFNTSYYGDLRAVTMEALGRLLAGKAYVVHGAAVEIGGRGLSLLYPKEVIHPTPPWGLMELPGAKFVADGWLVAEASGRLHAVEKGLYFRTSLIESYPDLAPRIFFSKFENVPAATLALADQKMSLAEAILEAATRTDARLRSLPPERARELLVRLVASPDSRAIVDAAALFGKHRLLASTTAAAVFAMRAGGGDPIRPFPIEPFPCPGYEVHVGAIPGHPREVARQIAAR